MWFFFFFLLNNFWMSLKQNDFQIRFQPDRCTLGVLSPVLLPRLISTPGIVCLKYRSPDRTGRVCPCVCPRGTPHVEGGVLINGIYDLANWYLQLGPELLRLWRWFNHFYENTKELMLLIMHVAFCAIGVRQRLSFREGKTGFPSSLQHTAQ